MSSVETGDGQDPYGAVTGMPASLRV